MLLLLQDQKLKRQLLNQLMIDFTTYENWSPSTKLYYGLYECKVKLKTQPNKFNFNNINSFIMTSNEEMVYRKRVETQYNYNSADINVKWNSTPTIYTSHRGLLDFICNTYAVSEICTPASKSHMDALHSLDISSEIRETLYYRKYKYKFEGWQTYRNANYGNVEALQDAVKWLYNYYGNDSNTRMSPDKYIYIGKVRYSYMGQVPRIYTNDQSGLMLFKLSFNNIVDKIKVTEAVILDEII
jgi:hypothetical protein